MYIIDINLQMHLLLQIFITNKIHYKKFVLFSL